MRHILVIFPFQQIRKLKKSNNLPRRRSVPKSEFRSKVSSPKLPPWPLPYGAWCTRQYRATKWDCIHKALRPPCGSSKYVMSSHYYYWFTKIINHTFLYHFGCIKHSTKIFYTIFSYVLWDSVRFSEVQHILKAVTCFFDFHNFFHQSMKQPRSIFKKSFIHFFLFINSCRIRHLLHAWHYSRNCCWVFR